MNSRRKFLRNISLAAAATWITTKFVKADSLGSENIFNSEKNLSSPASKGNIILSTWAAGVAANEKALSILNAGGKAVDAAEQGVMVTESDKTNTSVGLSGFPDRDGHVTLDACIMDEEGNAGAVTFLEGIEHPVSVARMVMEKTPHVILSGDGAQQFALENGFELHKGMTDVARKAWEDWQKTSNYKPVISKENHDTIGLIIKTAEGKLSGSCTTSGLAFKMHGRVGDSPIIGAGLFVDPEVGAATATGLGEAVIKICGAHTIVEMMRNGKTPQQACEAAMKRLVKLQKNYRDIQIGFLALNLIGEIGAFGLQPGFQYSL
ncbi:MAG: N(4)-(beta-N-acetylglucosaminyl)-L-asparaginase, partial [Chitinophagales bacterium]|nr:N(4)-(beta-N-acetylglucosaminyl)-L-asparaginase [Chitinophagales bacterium]